MKEKIPFNWPCKTGKELEYIQQCYSQGQLAGDGPFTKRCHQWIEHHTKTKKALLTHSCTAALEMSALLLDLKPGDEVILPSFTFVSTANAFVLRGATPVFVDIRNDTLNIDESLIETAITKKTKAIVPVHYAGVSCEMDTILEIAKRNAVSIIEDAAQGILSSYKGKILGSIGDFGTYSFHETKNLICGEGGALLINNSEHIARAEIIREKGTDRSQFFRGEVDKYTWQDIGSSYLPGELSAAFLWAQLESSQDIISQRLQRWGYYHQELKQLESDGFLRRPILPETCTHNGHMYYVLLNPSISRDKILEIFRKENIHAVFHYVPLHSSPAGMRYGRTHGELSQTNKLSEHIIRLPLWADISEEEQNRVLEILFKAIKTI